MKSGKWEAQVDHPTAGLLQGALAAFFMFKSHVRAAQLKATQIF